MNLADKHKIGKSCVWDLHERKIQIWKIIYIFLLSNFKLFCFIPGIVLLLAPILPLPYSFYIFLRYAVTIYSLIVLFHLYSKSYLIVNLEITLAMVVIVFLYNPIYPIYLPREVWFPINWITSGIIFWYYNQIKGVQWNS